jgi:DNA-binding transcriptional ArsR family regulator
MEVKSDFTDEDFKFVMDTITKYVKYEDGLVKLVLYTCMSAWTPEPLNLFLTGQSSTGKTWIVKHVVKVFPRQNVWILGDISPKALIHLPSKLIDDSGNEIVRPKKPSRQELRENQELRKRYENELEEYREKMKNARHLIELDRKILVLLETPNRETFKMLRPLLSHDEREINYKFVDRSSKQLITFNVTLRGWPAFICCSSDAPWMEDMVTRSLTASPTVSTEKFRAAHGVTAMRFLNPLEPQMYEKSFQEAEGKISKILGNFQIKAFIPYADILKELYPSKQPRDMRDFRYFLSLIEINTAFSPHPRLFDMKMGLVNIATLQDLKDVEDVWWKIYSTTIYGIPQESFLIFDVVKEIASSGIDPTTTEIRQKILEKVGLHIPQSTIRYRLDSLSDIGLVEKRKAREGNINIYYPVVKKNEEESPAPLCGDVTKRFRKKELEETIFGLTTKAKLYYNIENREPELRLIFPSGDVYKPPFSDDVLEKLYIQLCLCWRSKEAENKPLSEKEGSKLQRSEERGKNLASFLNDNGGV